MKRELIYAAVIGGVVGAVLVMAAGSIAPLGAQNEAADAEFGTITCSKLVVRYDGFPYSTEIDMFGVDMVGTGGLTMVKLTGTENGGAVLVYGKEGGGSAGMEIDEDGGAVRVYGKDGRAATMGIGKNGGSVDVFGKDGGGGATMGIDEDGGLVSVHGRGDPNTRAVMGVNEHGNGAVSTWDKNGYRRANLE